MKINFVFLQYIIVFEGFGMSSWESALLCSLHSCSLWIIQSKIMHELFKNLLRMMTILVFSPNSKNKGMCSGEKHKE